MDLSKLKVDDLSKVAQAVKASTSKSSEKAIDAAEKQVKALDKLTSKVKDIAKENPDI